ncbi:nucleoside hydrolase [Variovorax sp. J22G73]|uniref:nucleoside hydrolase n=1 Tax=unclassified Variovorax TaxID=663243 RepID=UPI000D5D5765|nr:MULTISPECIES: nucleoside hydrolase [unclassified Variovorax]MDM0007388.1 nucleoside hydrolase [Variovorax sp. J22R203]MDM0100253.1 nucleoside hydrolase [Variovorax sp. J22G73]
MRKWLVATLVVVSTVLAGCGGGGNGGGAGAGGIGLGPGFGGQPGSSGGTAQKIIIDSDYNTMSDDGQLGVMAAQLQADGKVQVMGISVVSGNQWLRQGVADALMSVERLGVGDRIGVYVGANYALNHTLADVDAEMAAGAGGDGYLGAWGGPEPKTDADLKPSPDGFARHTVVQRKSAVDFIVDTVKANPGEVTILAIGPLTNIALAVKQNPEIVPLIKKIIYMGGAVDVPGNTTKAAEFNWWFDPDAAQFVVRLPIPQVVVPLDVTDTVFLTKPVYDRIAHPAKPTAVTDVFQKLNGYGFDGKNGFETNASYTQNIWDTLTLAYLIDPSYATQTAQRYVDVVAKPGAPDNGRSIGYSEQPAGPTLQKMTVVQRFDNARFFDLYVDLLTRPVPVVLPAAN